MASASQLNPYARQYSHVYSARLALLRERCLANAKQSARDEGIISGENEDECSAERIIEVKEGVWSILVGTIVKEMDPKRRPPVQSKYNDATDAQSFLFPSDGGNRSQMKQIESLRSYLFDSEKGDVLHLEDESGRVELAPEDETHDAMSVDVDGGSFKKSNALDPNNLATGVVAAVVGKVCATKGIMKVHSIHFAGVPLPDATSRAMNNDAMQIEEEEHVLLLVSGLGCGSDSPTDGETGASLALRREMLLEYLTDPSLSNGASVCRVIIAGGGVSPSNQSAGDIGPGGPNKENSKKNYNKVAKSKSSKTSDAANHMAFSLRELDLFISELLSSGIPVDYIPGWHDPTNANWPQRPLHSCLLPLSCTFVDLFSRCTNPYEGTLGVARSRNGAKNAEISMKVLGSDGLSVADLRRFLSKSDSTKDNDAEKNDVDDAKVSSCMDALHKTLKYGHMAPTGPDSLPTFPSSESDPFVLSSRPDVYFVGNCDKFETRLVNVDGKTIDESGDDKVGKCMTRLVCVPSFALTGEVVLVKLKSLECEVVSFNDANL
jgi:DNA polymerase delta subunit 2